MMSSTSVDSERQELSPSDVNAENKELHTIEPLTSRRYIKRARLACSMCRNRKVRCIMFAADGACANCQKDEIVCTFRKKDRKSFQPKDRAPVVPNSVVPPPFFVLRKQKIQMPILSTGSAGLSEEWNDSRPAKLGRANLLRYACSLNYSLMHLKKLDKKLDTKLHRALLQSLISSLCDHHWERLTPWPGSKPDDGVPKNAAQKTSKPGISIPHASSDDELDLEEEEECAPSIEPGNKELRNGDWSSEIYATPESLEDFNAFLPNSRPRQASEEGRLEQIMAAYMSEFD